MQDLCCACGRILCLFVSVIIVAAIRNSDMREPPWEGFPPSSCCYVGRQEPPPLAAWFCLALLRSGERGTHTPVSRKLSVAGVGAPPHGPHPGAAAESGSVVGSRYSWTFRRFLGPPWFGMGIPWSSLWVLLFELCWFFRCLLDRP